MKKYILLAAKYEYTKVKKERRKRKTRRGSQHWMQWFTTLDARASRACPATTAMSNSYDRDRLK
jgi:hypothetical protein